MKKGDKVYVLVEAYNYDYEQEVRTSVFLNKEDACKALADVKEIELKESWISKYDEDDLEVGEDSYDSFDIYLLGYAAQYETHLWVVEKEVR